VAAQQPANHATLHGDQVDQLLARHGQRRATPTGTADPTARGSVATLIDNSGNVKDAINYDAFGNIISETDSA